MRILLIKYTGDTLNAFAQTDEPAKARIMLMPMLLRKVTFACHVRASNQTDFGDAGNIENYYLHDCSLQSTDGLQLPQLKQNVHLQ